MLLLRNCTGEVVVQATSIPNSELPGPKVKGKKPEVESSSDESVSSLDIHKAAASGTTAEQLDESLQSKRSREKSSSGESLRRYWSSDGSEHWINIKKAKMSRSQAKRKQQEKELQLGEPSSSAACR